MSAAPEQSGTLLLEVELGKASSSCCLLYPSIAMNGENVKPDKTDLPYARTGAQFLAPVPRKQFFLWRTAAARSASCGLEDKACSAGVGALDYSLNGLVARIIRHGQDFRRCGLGARVEVFAAGVLCLAEAKENVGRVG